MSVEYYMACTQCKQAVNIASDGLSGFRFYRGEPSIMEKLHIFLEAHILHRNALRIIDENALEGATEADDYKSAILQDAKEMEEPASGETPIESVLHELKEFRRQDDYLLANGASLMSEDSHEIIHIDTLSRIIFTATHSLERQRNELKQKLEASRMLHNATTEALRRLQEATQVDCELHRGIRAPCCPVCLLQERNELREQMRWHPIETAPKDGTNILLINRKGNMATGIWQEDGWWLRGGNRPNVFFNDHHGPTHWMPLPQPPKDSGDA